MKFFTKIVFFVILIQSSITYAMPINQFYGAIEGGVFKAQFNNKYSDLTDLIPQNVTNASLQNGYTGGVRIGYTRLLNKLYFTGIELSGNLNGNSALYESGAATTAFSDNIQINHNLDLAFIAGIKTDSAFYPYLKIGVSYASIHDRLTSPVGYNVLITSYNINKNGYGGVMGVGVKYTINERSGLFIEANYHDYGTLNLLPFQNFSASYAHSAHIYSYAALIGASYAFNV